MTTQHDPDAEPPAAFMSYAHFDDRDRRVSKLRERLTDELQYQMGFPVPIFQDSDKAIRSEETM